MRIQMTALCLTVLIAVSSAKEFQEVNGIVAMEAENATSMGWKLITGGVQDGGSGSLEFKITFKQTGKYYVWVRGATGANGCGNDLANDCFLKFDGRYLSLMDYTGKATAIGVRWPNSTCKVMQWHQGPKTEPDHPSDWSSISTRPVYANVSSAGTHTLSIIHRSTGLMIDRVVMQLNKSTKPSGTGPAETVKGGSTITATPLAAAAGVRTSSSLQAYAIDGSVLGPNAAFGTGIVVRVIGGRVTPTTASITRR